MFKRLLAVGVLALGIDTSALADYRIYANSIMLNDKYGVTVTNAIVNGVSRNISCTLYYVPEGAEVLLALGDCSGFMWGTNNLIRIPSVTSDMEVNTLPEDIRAYRGKVDTPVIICEYDDLLQLKRRIEGGRNMYGFYFKQTQDIDFKDRPAWSTIGSATREFQGVYDGCGHRLDNLCLANQKKSSFICYLTGGSISNLTVRFAGVDDTSGSNVGAALVGDANSDFSIRNVTVEGELTNLTGDGAGIAMSASAGEIVNCTNRVNISGCSSKMGGIAARIVASSSTKFPGVDFINCVNEGNITSLKVGTKVGGSSGIGGIVGEMLFEQQTRFVRCINRGTLTPAAPKARIGSILGSVYNDEPSATGEDCEAAADMNPVGIFRSNSYTLADFNFARVESGWAKLCGAPTAAGDYRVMLTNGENIVLADVKVGDQLTLDNYEAFTGTVTCANSAFTVTGGNGVWTVGGGMSTDAGSIDPGATEGVYVLVPAADQTAVTVSGFTGSVLQVPSGITAIKGVEREKLEIRSGGYDITAAMAFAGNADDGYTLTLDGSATVGGVKVTPTIGENVDNPFTVGDGVKLVIKSIPGLWYGLWRGDEPTSITNLTTKVMASGGTVTLEDAPDAGNGHFYKVGVTVR